MVTCGIFDTGLHSRRSLPQSIHGYRPHYLPESNRYDGRMPYRRCGRSGLDLPLISLGFWHNFGDDKPLATQREIMHTAFDLGITHFDLANNYGPPFGSAEINAGRILREDFARYRDELVISSKAGWDMWPGPYGDLGSRKYMLASLDQSLERLGLDYVDIFYHHRPDPNTPLEESMGALATAVSQGKALYVGISSYGPARTLRAAEILADLGVPLLIHQPSYSLLNRWIEDDGLLDALTAVGAGSITFSPLAQGMLNDPFVDGIPELPSNGRQIWIPPFERRERRPPACTGADAARGVKAGSDGCGMDVARCGSRRLWWVRVRLTNSARPSEPWTTWRSARMTLQPLTRWPSRVGSTCGGSSRDCRRRGMGADLAIGVRVRRCGSNEPSRS